MPTSKDVALLLLKIQCLGLSGIVEVGLVVDRWYWFGLGHLWRKVSASVKMLFTFLEGFVIVFLFLMPPFQMVVSLWWV